MQDITTCVRFLFTSAQCCGCASSAVVVVFRSHAATETGSTMVSESADFGLSPPQWCCAVLQEFSGCRQERLLAMSREDAKDGSLSPAEPPKEGINGEARKLEVWDAAAAACMESQDRVLKRILGDGWPQAVDATVPWDMWDVLEEWKTEDYLNKFATNETLQLQSLIYRVFRKVKGDTALSLAEWKLFNAAVAEPNPDCLSVLLTSGCHSLWLCRAAAHAKDAFALKKAVDHGCSCDVWNIFIATSNNDKDLLHQVYELANPELDIAKAVISLSAKYAAARGYIACMKILVTDTMRTSGGALFRYGVGHSCFAL